MFVFFSRFTVKNNMMEEVKDAFRKRPHLVDKAAGFIRLDVISPLDNPDEIWLITIWEDEGSFKSWHRSHAFRESHKWIPKGLQLVSKSAQIRSFEYVCS